MKTLIARVSSSSPVPPRASLTWPRALFSIVTAAFAATSAFAAPSATIVISQVYGGGGNIDAPFTHDFVELHNISGAPVDITGWSIQHAGATSAPASWSSTGLIGIVPAGAYHLIRLSAGAGNGSALPSADASGISNLNAEGGKIALTNTTEELSGSSPIGDPALVDFVGYGTSADAFEGSGSTAATSAIKSAFRKDFGSLDTDDNASDFETGAPAPRNSASPIHIPAADTNPPLVVSRNPDVAAIGVSLETSLSITFDEPIAAGAGGVQLFREAGETDVLVPIGAVAIAGSTAEFTPAAPLEAGTTYYVLIDATAFTDLVAPTANQFAGVSSETDWTFTTITPPVLDSFALGDGAAIAVTPRATLDFASSGGAPAEFLASESPDFQGAAWVPFSAATPSHALTSGDGSKTVYLKLRNSAGESAVLDDSITRAAYSNPGTLLITQYYEGAANNKYVEITNTTAGAINLAGWKLVRWGNADAENWKITGSSTSSSSGIIDLAGTLAAGQTVVFANSDAATPIPAAGVFLSDAKISHNGDDSYGLYDGIVSPENLRDALSFTDAGNEGADTSFVRTSAGLGFDFASGTSIAGFPAVWQEFTITAVDAAGSGQNEFLGTYPGAPSGYGSWAATNVDNQPANLDFDGDGIDNGSEYFMGSDPAAFTVNPGLVAGSVMWPRAAGTVIGAFRVEVSNDLANWEDAALEYGANLDISAAGVSFTPPTGAGSLFMRLSVTP